MPVAFQDYYDALEVSRDASQDEIRQAYRRLARKYHPDVNKDSGAEDRFKQVSEAYEVLRDPDKRARYDRLGSNWKAGDDVSSAGFGGYDAGNGFGDVRVEFGSDDSAAGFSDFFDSFFTRRGGVGGTGAGGRAGFAMRGGDYEAVLELGLEEAADGGKRWLSLGDGRSVEVDIPRGVLDGERIRVPGEGTQGLGGGPAGDLYLRIRLKPHRRFRVDGADLYVDLPVAPWEAALGAEVPVPTLSGAARVKVPAGSSSGRRLRLRGQGMPGRAGRPGGDLYAVVTIRVPNKLTKKERELFERLASVSKFDPRRGSR
jgi:curved DNA-binding protein